MIKQVKSVLYVVKFEHMIIGKLGFIIKKNNQVI